MEPSSSRHVIIQALVNNLKTIRGGSYWTDLGARVYTRVREPGNDGGDGIATDEYPILFLVENGEPAEIRDDGRGMRFEMQLKLVGYVRELSQDKLTTTTMESCSKLHDDIVQCLMHNASLGGWCQPITLLGESFVIGLDPEFAGFQLALRVPYYVTREGLGPLAS